MSTEEQVKFSQEEITQVNFSFNELKDTMQRFEDGKLGKGEYKEKMENIENSFKSYDEKNQQLVMQIDGEKKKHDDLEKKMDELERRSFSLKRSDIDVAKHEKEACEFYCKLLAKGDRRYTQEEQAQYESYFEAKYLRTDKNPEGGFLVIPEFVQRILKRAVDISPIRAIASIMATGNKMVEIPKRTGEPIAQWIGEGETVPDTQSVYGLENILTHSMKTFTPISIEMTQDSEFDMSAQIAEDTAQAFALAEGIAFTTGIGSDRPEGILTNPDVASFVSDAVGVIGYDDIVDLQSELKLGYTGNARFILNKKTLAAVRKIKDTVGQPIWTPLLMSGNPAEISGDAYTVVQAMPDVASGNEPIVYGDFMRAYQIVDRIGMFALFDDRTRLVNGIFAWFFMKRVGGQVVLADALKKLVIAA